MGRNGVDHSLKNSKAEGLGRDQELEKGFRQSGGVETVEFVSSCLLVVRNKMIEKGKKASVDVFFTCFKRFFFQLSLLAKRLKRVSEVGSGWSKVTWRLSQREWWVPRIQLDKF